MDRFGTPRAVGIYRWLIRLYPVSFREYYGVTMVQTLVDMLEAEPTKIGRANIWANALFDVVKCATKEQLTHGSVIMNGFTKLVIGFAVVAILIAGIASFWVGSLRARQSVGIVRTDVSTLADAIQQDHFYSSYGNTALLFTAKVSAVSSTSDRKLVTFTTDRAYSVTCQMSSGENVEVGQTIAIAAPGGSAERLAAGVRLHDCLKN